MTIYVINLDRSTDRLAQFQRVNRHLTDVVRFPAIDGALVNRRELIEDGIITEDMPYGPGTLGSALSHLGLWSKAVSENRMITIFEDDVICSNQFYEKSAQIISRLPEDWDTIQWCYAFDPTFVWLDFEFAKAKLEFYDYRYSAANGSTFQSRNFFPNPVRTVHSFGIQAYSVSPKGARALLEYCLPLRKRLIPFPGTDTVIEDNSIDAGMCGAYGSMQAFVCIPPLVIADDEQTSERFKADQG